MLFFKLVGGRIQASSRRQYFHIIQHLAGQGAEGVILGCTELGLLVRQPGCRLPLFDATRLHAAAAVEYALAGED